MHEVSVEKTPTVRLPELIDSVKNGDEIIFTENDKPVARLSHIRPSEARPQFGSARGVIIVADDLDEPLPDFEDYQ